MSERAQNALRWISAFGEGFAMLAAAGGPKVHPHEVSNPDERARWDQDMKNFNLDLAKIEVFLQRVLGTKVAGEEMQREGFAFFGIQGPWYTVGWRMGALIEETYGRQKLIEVMCDQRMLLPTYNQAAREHLRKTKEPLAMWSASVVTLQ
jgi:hypothetical protein